MMRMWRLQTPERRDGGRNPSRLTLRCEWNASSHTPRNQAEKFRDPSPSGVLPSDTPDRIASLIAAGYPGLDAANIRKCETYCGCFHVEWNRRRKWWVIGIPAIEEDFALF